MIPKKDMVLLFNTIKQKRENLQHTNFLNRISYFDSIKVDIKKYVRVYQTVFHNDLAFLYILNSIYKV